MDETVKVNKIETALIRLFVNDALERLRVRVTHFDDFIYAIQQSYGYMYYHDGVVHFENNITRPMGSSSVVTPYGFLPPESYFMFSTVPDSIMEIKEYAAGANDLMTAAVLANYPIQQIINPSDVSLDAAYMEKLSTLMNDLYHYVEFFTTEELEGDSKFDIAQQNQESFRRLEAFLDVSE